VFGKKQKNFLEALEEGYSAEDCVLVERDEFWDVPAIIHYNPLKLATYRVFWVEGSSLRHPVLLVELMLTSCLFLCIATVTMWYIDHQVGSDKNFTTRHWLEMQEDKMRDFAVIMTGITTFLLSFYMSMVISRWWDIITKGIAQIETSVMELSLYVYQLVTKDEEVITSIRRYTRASLFLIILWRRNKLDNLKEMMAKKKDLLTPSECDKLMSVKHNLHEVIWSWTTDIISMLYQEGQIKSDCLLQLLLDRCTQGRGAVQLIHTYIANKVPLQYVHLLGFLVKIHNVALALIMSLLFAVAWRNENWIMCTMLFARTLLLPTLFNAIILLCSELSDPFDGGMQDLPADRCDEHINKNSMAYIALTDNAPKWISERRAKNQREAQQAAPSASK